jgi:DNA polymerase-3 subunit gamma/tau
MAHQAIYRKYRPKTFEDVVGQKHITDTLKNQIMRNSTAHAYLFSGIRGTGKTSTAKIFARAMNCTNNTDGNPCNKCEACLSILSERNMDVIEMDAASNNSVEDIRDLREKVKFMPSQSKYKVYIIDEVHMLSKGAFNALLKTLEEPPAHLLFILATTEPQKIPATILSRCQRFDLKRITVDDLIHNMKMICDDIGIKAEEEALRMIANSSEGAMRDALSILDRCMIYSSDIITYDAVINLLGTVNYTTILNFTNSLIKKDIRQALVQIDEILSEGKEIELFLEDLIGHLRNLLILKSVEDSQKFISYGEDAIKQLKDQSEKISIEENIRLIEELSETLALCKKTVNGRILLETRIIKLLSLSFEAPMVLADKDIVNIKPERVRKEEKAKTLDIEATEEDKLKPDNKQHKDMNISNKVHVSNKSEDFKLIKSNWDNILKRIKREKISLNAVIKEGKPYSAENDEIVIRFAENYTFHYNKANTKESIELVQGVINGLLNRNFKVKFIIEGSEKNEAVEESSEEIKAKVNQKAFEIFGKDKVEIID